MATLVSISTEKRVLRTIVERNQVADHLLSVLRPDHFGYEPCKQAFTRASKLLAKNGRLPAWEVFIDDPSFDEDLRKTLGRIDKDPIHDLQVARDSLAVLNEQRESRIILEILEREGKAIGKDPPDVIKDRFNKALQDLYRTNDLAEDTWSAGIGKEARRKVRREIKKMLTPRKDRTIPTGFRAFDIVNLGILRGTMMLIGGPTGTGKSLVSTAMGLNMAMRGAKVLKVTLEMNFEQEMTRVLANLTAVETTKIANPASLSEKMRQRIVDEYVEFDKYVEAQGGSFSILVPSAGLRMEALLAWLRPQEFDVVIIDYLGLLEGIGDSDQQWRTMGEAARQAAVHAANTGTIMCLLVQVTDDGVVRYARAVEEHAALAWKWKRPEQKEKADGKRGGKSREAAAPMTTSPSIHVQPSKSRNQKPIEFPLFIGFDCMQVSSEVDELGTTWKTRLGIEDRPPPEPKRTTPRMRDMQGEEDREFVGLKQRLHERRQRDRAAGRGSKPPTGKPVRRKM